MSLMHTPVSSAVVLDDAPVAMLFAILDLPRHSQEHAAIVYKQRGRARG
jgi:hypothetical protein